MTWLNEQHILVYAFRYALSRDTYAVADVVELLATMWGTLEPQFRLMIVEEIKQELEVHPSLKTGVYSKRWLELLAVAEN